MSLLLALDDLSSAYRRRRVWIALANEDIGDQHRRTTLGPLWLLVNYLAFAGTFVVIFGPSEGRGNYATHVAVGLFVWVYINEVVSQAITLFVREESFIKGTVLPLTIYVMRMTMQVL